MDVQKSRKSEFIYLLIAVAIAAGVAILIGLPDPDIGLFAALGLMGIALMMAIYITPSLGADVLIIAIFTNISDELTNRGYPSIIKPLVGVVALAIFVKYFQSGRGATAGSDKTSRVEFFLFLLFVVTTISFLVADDKDRAMNAILDLGKDIVILYCIVYALRSPQVWKRSAWVLIGVTAFLCILGAYQYFTGRFDNDLFGMASVKFDSVVEGSSTRLAGPINAPNMWGQTVVAVIAILMFRLFHEPRQTVKLLTVGMLGFMLLETLNTYSRGAYLALGVAVLLMMFVFEKRINRMMALSAVGLFVLSIPFWPSTYAERLGSLSILTSSASNEYAVYEDSSLRGRSSEMLTGLAMFEAHPIIGVGAGNYRNNYQSFSQLIGIEVRSEERDAHSLYLQILAETGVLGFIAFAGAMASLFIALGKARTLASADLRLHDWLPWLNAMQVSLISYLVAATFLHGAYIRYFWILVALTVAAIQITYDLLEERPQKPLIGNRF